MSSKLLVLLLLGTAQRSFVGADSYVGCLFSEDLCLEETQWCFDDGAFGRCLSNGENFDPQELYRYNLDKDDLEVLEYELGNLLQNGYMWSHLHTQCVLQAMLYSFQTGTDLEKVICDRLKEKDLESALRSDVGLEQLDPRSVAYIKYTPSMENPGTDFADEVYHPPEQEKLFNNQDGREHDGPYALVRRSLPADRKWDHFSALYNTPEHFRSGLEIKDLPMSDQLEDDGTVEYFPIPAPYPLYERDLLEEPQLDDNGLDFIGEDDNDDEDTSNNEPESPSTGYTEGGVVIFPNKDSRKNHWTKDSLLETLGFMRRERLDVKKPGPPYDPAFLTTKKPTNEGQKEEIVDLSNKQEKSKAQKKVIDHIDSNEYEVVDTTYTYIVFKNSIHVWNEGKRVVDAVAHLLKIPRRLFSDERVGQHEVTFKVHEPNNWGLNASEVAKRIDAIKDELRRETGVVVTSTGIGDKTKLPSVVQLNGHPDHEFYVATVIVCGVFAALGLSAGVFYLTRKHGHKLKNFTASVTEPSKHYQDLCRAKMSNKGNPQSQAEAGTATTQRITSLSKESDKESPSSRSSTSSWSDEPALTNMDTSTGQIVLTYMEEHLKNKERLDSEWNALCSYEADPCATTIAQRAENLQKNRYPHALPYDHARVVLNELSNITESDYINASTITDHDPRNAAYIVTQGPLPHTVPDLWQMIWEQGCVVIVMLTRFGEQDAPLCHRYWPEDGSEIYHIFEVHLVGEYMWCDDYAVRSFYLKNLKTGETRTVTQFHFLSWPDAGVPPVSKSLLEFRRKVNKSFRGRSCPIVVHCSDGVGRSGTYVLLDMVLNRIAKGAKEIDIAATLEHIRDQRAGAVATKKQFQFVLTSVADEVQAILKVLQQQ